MAKQGVKHLVQCVCTLQTLNNMKDPPSHEFVVFSTYDDADDSFDVTFVQCDNCGLVHKVVDVCKSEVVRGKEDLAFAISIADVRSSLNPNIVEVLEKHNASLPTWQQTAWIVTEKRWGESVTLGSERVNNVKQGKVMILLGESLYRLQAYTTEEST